MLDLVRIIQSNHMEVTQISNGSCFGELALISNKPRAATIKCLEDCYFGILSKENYDKSFGKLQRKEIDKIITFFKSCPQFASWTRSSLSKLYYFWKKQKCYRDQVLLKEGQNCDKIYIVLSGEFEQQKMIRKAAETEVQYSCYTGPLAIRERRRRK